MRITTMLMAMALLVSFHALPQGPAPQSQVTTAAILKKTVGFLRADYHDRNEVGQIAGTCFLVDLEDGRLGQDGGFLYLVTNRHMVAPEKDGRKLQVDKVSIRLNLKSPPQNDKSQEFPLSPGVAGRWYFSPDESVDLAVAPVTFNPDVIDMKAIPSSLFATKSTLESEGIGEGDKVLFTGFFYQLTGLKRVEPIVREGVLAMIPEEELMTTTQRLGHLYLADIHAFGGNSGSPMFLELPAVRGNSFRWMRFPFRLIGVVSGYYYEDEDLKLRVATTLVGKLSANSGVSTVVPVDELKAVLELPELQAQRDTYVTAHPPGR